MAKRKKLTPVKKAIPKQYDEDDSMDSMMLKEPVAPYGVSIPAARAIAFMGSPGKKSFFPVRNESDFIDMIRKGIPKKSIDNLVEKTGIPVNEMAVLMRLSDRTLRRYDPQTLLNPEQSERVVEISRLYSRGEDVFGNLDNFKEWMNSSVMALGNIKPKTLLDTSLGIDILMNELGRIEHGIFA
ncbi:MAG: type II RES/Xre toxin-antitoxin system antitoxin [Chitinophagaceae bacterium]